MMIKKIVMATNNLHKLKEVREVLSPLGIEVISQIEAGAEVQPDETGRTFQDNAIIKAQAVYNIVKIPTIADDSGLCVDALYGAPGVYSARYAPKGQECAKLLNAMDDVPENQRKAYFECCIAFVDGSGSIQAFVGKCEGYIATEARGKNGFGYDPVFLFGGKTLAEMTSEEKNKISHRGSALRNLYNYLKERNGEE